MAEAGSSGIHGGLEVKRSRSQKNRQVAPVAATPERDSAIIQPVQQPPVPKVSAPPFHTAIEIYGSQSGQVDSGFYKNPLNLMLCLAHVVVAIAAMGLFGFKGIQSALKSEQDGKFHIEYWYPQLAVAAAVGAVFSLVWQRLVITRPEAMVKWALWSSPTLSFAAALMLVSTSVSAGVIVGVFMLLFSICQALYSSWASPRVKYAQKILHKALAPTTIFRNLHHPSYWIVIIAVIWILGWTLGVVGAISQKYAAFSVLAFVISLAWIMVVLRNIVNVTVSRVVALFFLRGMCSDPFFCLQRAMTTSLGSINLGSMMVPALEALRVMARAVNLMEVEDEFMYSCAHCYLGVMEAVFRFGNIWGLVQVAAYGKGFVKASQDTWQLILDRNLEALLNQDLTSSICFLSGITGGSLCGIAAGAWTFVTHKNLTTTISFLSFLMGYFMTRITMAVPQACVCAYYVCFAENPQNRVFDSTIPDRMTQLEGAAASET